MNSQSSGQNQPRSLTMGIRNTMRKTVWITVAMAGVASGQTKLDLSKQSRAVDFSQSPSTQPFTTGTALPATCSVGQMFFVTAAPSGQNIYGCASTNTWTLQSGGGPGPAGPTGPTGVMGPAGPAGLGGTIANNGAVVGTRQTIDFSTGQGLMLAASDTGQEISVNSLIDTSYVQTRPNEQAGTALLCSSAGGSVTTYSCAMNPTLTGYTTGMVLFWRPDVNGIGGPTTINVDLLGATPLTMPDGVTNPTASAIVAGNLYPIWYDGTVFRYLSAGSGSSGGGGGTGATGATGPAGPQGQGYTWRGAWSSSTTYAPYDTVSFGGSSWVAILAGTNYEPDVSPSYWNLVAAAGSGAGSAAAWPSGMLFLPFGPMWAGAGNYFFPVTNGSRPTACAFVTPAAVTLNNWYFSLHSAATSAAGFDIALYDASGNLLPGSTMNSYYNSGSTSDLKTAGARFGAPAAPQNLAANTKYYVAWEADTTAITFDGYGNWESVVFNLLNANGGNQCGVASSPVTGQGSTLAMPATLGTLTPYSSSYDDVPYVGMK